MPDTNGLSAGQIVQQAVDAAIEIGSSADAKKVSKGGGWMAAIAEAMGRAMAVQAARVVGLSNAIADNVTERSYDSVVSGDAAKGMSKEQITADAKDAAMGQLLNTQFQAASQELSLSSNAFATAIKALGEASTTLARKS